MFKQMTASNWGKIIIYIFVRNVSIFIYILFNCNVNLHQFDTLIFLTFSLLNPWEIDWERNCVQEISEKPLGGNLELRDWV